MSKLMENFMFSSEHELQVDFTEVFFWIDLHDSRGECGSLW